MTSFYSVISKSFRSMTKKNRTKVTP